MPRTSEVADERPRHLVKHILGSRSVHPVWRASRSAAAMAGYTSGGWVTWDRSTRGSRPSRRIVGIRRLEARRPGFARPQHCAESRRRPDGTYPGVPDAKPVAKPTQYPPPPPWLTPRALPFLPPSIHPPHPPRMPPRPLPAASPTPQTAQFHHPCHFTPLQPHSLPSSPSCPIFPPCGFTAENAKERGRAVPSNAGAVLDCPNPLPFPLSPPFSRHPRSP